MARGGLFLDEFDEYDGLDEYEPLGPPGLRRGIPANFGAPTSDERLDDFLGVEPPEMIEDDEEEFEASPLDLFLERGDIPDFGRQTNPIAAALAGLGRGLASRGVQVSERRKKFEQGQAARAKARDAANLQASRDYRARRFQATQAALGREDMSKRERKRYENENRKPTPAQLAAAPWLARVADPEGRVPVEYLVNAMKPKDPKAPKEERLVAIETPDGPRYVRESDALGKPPAKGSGDKPGKPSPGERDALIGDIGMLDQVGRLRDVFRPHFVGPAAGRYGAVTQASGLGKRKGEASFRGALSGIRNQILKLRSGGAVSDGEAARLLQELPTENDPSDVFGAKLDEFERTYRSIAETRRGTLSATGIDLTGVADLPKSRRKVDQEYEEYLRRVGGR